MSTEIEDLREHFERYRAVTLQHLEYLADEQLSWRPRPDAFSCGQHFVHLFQTEDFYMRGLFQRDWNIERLRFPKELPRKVELRDQFDAVRKVTLIPICRTPRAPRRTTTTSAEGQRPDIEARANLGGI